MTRLSDELIKQLAAAKAPHAYSHEVIAMAQEIAERRAKDAQALNQAQAQQTLPGIPNPYGGIPYP